MHTKFKVLLRATALLVVLFSLSAPPVLADSIDLALVARMTGQQDVAGNDKPDSGKNEQILNAVASSETGRVGQGDKNWNPKSPLWGVVYTQVRKDYETDIPDLAAEFAQGSAELQRQYETAVASKLSQSDVDTIIAYYNSPEGKRFEAFMASIDTVLSSGAKALVNGKETGPQSAKPTPEQLQLYMRMAKLSHMAQSMIAVQGSSSDKTGYAAVGFVAGIAISKNLPELASLSSKYSQDIPKFENFEATPPMQKLMKAMGFGMSQMIHTQNSVAKLIKDVEDKHGAAWRALYVSDDSAPSKPSEQ